MESLNDEFELFTSSIEGRRWTKLSNPNIHFSENIVRKCYSNVYHGRTINKDRGIKSLLHISFVHWVYVMHRLLMNTEDTLITPWYTSKYDQWINHPCPIQSWSAYCVRGFQFWMEDGKVSYHCIFRYHINFQKFRWDLPSLILLLSSTPLTL